MKHAVGSASPFFIFSQKFREPAHRILIQATDQGDREGEQRQIVVHIDDRIVGMDVAGGHPEHDRGMPSFARWNEPASVPPLRRTVI